MFRKVHIIKSEHIDNNNISQQYKNNKIFILYKSKSKNIQIFSHYIT